MGRVLIDDRGRIRPPSDVMRDARIAPGTMVDVSVLPDGGVIVLPVPPSCAVCGAQGTLLAEFGSDPIHHVCAACADDIVAHTLVFVPTTEKDV